MTKISSWLQRYRPWLLAGLVPFLVFFAIGAKVGWWLIDKDAGKYRASFSHEEPLSDYYYPTLMTGLVFGAAGSVFGLCVYGAMRRFKKSEES